MNGKKIDKIFFVLVFLTIYVMLFVFLIIPYWQHSVYQWDAAGQMSAVIFEKDNIFPGMFGWNSDGYMGFPFNKFYSPLFSWIVAGLSFITGIEYAFRIIVSLSVLLLPIAFYIVGKRYKFEKDKAIFFSICGLIFLCLPSYFFASANMGGNFDSLFYVGLVANSFSLILFLSYVAFLDRIKERKFFIMESILLSAVVLSHLVTGIAAALYSIAFIIGRQDDWKNTGKAWIRHVSVSFLITSFWIIPFIYNFRYSNSAIIPFVFNNVILVSFSLCCILLIYAYYKNDTAFSEVGVFIALLLIFILGIHLLKFGFHTYRLMLFFFIFIILLMVKIIKVNKIIVIIGIIGLFLGLSYYCHYNMIDKAYEKPIRTDIEGRTLIITNFNSGTNVQFLENMIPYWNPKVEGISYLFVESAVNGKEVNTLKRLIVSDGLVWGTIWNYDNTIKIPDWEKDNAIERGLDLFGIDNVITYTESSGLNYTTKKEIFKDKIYYYHNVFYIGNEILYGFDNNFIISKKNKNIYLMNNSIAEKFEIINEPEVNVFYKDDVLRDKLILCNPKTKNYYFLNKINSLDYNSFNYYKMNESEILNITKNSSIKLKCKQGEKFIKLNYNNSFGDITYSDIPMIEINNTSKNRINERSEMTWPLKYYSYELNKSYGEKIKIINENFSFINVEEGKWSDFVFDWFLGSNFSRLYVKGKDPLYKIRGVSMFSIQNENISRETIRFDVTNKSDVNYNEKVPVLIKVSYFPNWKAYENGKEIEIYEISPHLMMIYADEGEIELRYENTFFDTLGIMGSLIGILAIALTFYKWNHDKV